MDLIQMIKVAAGSLLEFGALWGSIKKKGGEEGFSEKELQEMLRPFLKEKLDSKKIWYLFHKDEQIERVQKNQEENRTKFSTNDVEKVIEQTSTPEQKEKEIVTAVYESQEEEVEEPTEAELLKIENEQLKDALHKTEQFVPAHKLDGGVQTFPPIQEEEMVEFLRKRDNKISCFFYDSYGIEAFKNRELSQLKNSGVKVFKRLYFEV